MHLLLLAERVHCKIVVADTGWAICYGNPIFKKSNLHSSALVRHVCGHHPESEEWSSLELSSVKCSKQLSIAEAAQTEQILQLQLEPSSPGVEYLSSNCQILCTLAVEPTQMFMAPMCSMSWHISPNSPETVTIDNNKEIPQNKN